MKLLLDMNLSPAWVPYLTAHGWQTEHWHSIGSVDAPDAEIMGWAKERGVLRHHP